jgi:hypothetical protein
MQEMIAVMKTLPASEQVRLAGTSTEASAV